MLDSWSFLASLWPLGGGEHGTRALSPVLKLVPLGAGRGGGVMEVIPPSSFQNWENKDHHAYIDLQGLCQRTEPLDVSYGHTAGADGSAPVHRAGPNYTDWSAALSVTLSGCSMFPGLLAPQ